MGNITHLDVDSILQRANIDNFIETGTCYGYAVQHMLDTSDIKNIMSIEIEPELYEMCCCKFADEPRVKLHCGHSPEILNNILPIKGSTLWWLDAHFPGADANPPLKEIHTTTDLEERCPLEKELTVIYDNGDYENDYFIIDDLRVYEDGPFQSGIWPDRHIYGRDGIDFIYNMFDRTHTIKKLYNDEGYIIMLPKDNL